MGLHVGVVLLGEGLGDDELREIDLVLEQVGDDALGVAAESDGVLRADALLGALDVALDEHLAEAGVDDGDDEAAIVTTDGLCES